MANKKKSRASLFFIILVALSAVFLAVNSAIFSITGLANLFAGASLAVMVMAASLETAKLLAASFLYRYWNRISKILRSYLVAGVCLLVIISSLGIFGFLSKAYQESTIGLQRYSLDLTHTEERLEQIQLNKSMLQDEMFSQLKEIPEENLSVRRQVRQQYYPMILDASEEVLDLQKKKAELKQEVLTTGVDVGPLLYMANALNADIDKVASGLILVLVFVFDPMALALVIALNTLLVHRQKLPEKKKKRKKEIIVSPNPPDKTGDESKFQIEASTL